MGAVRVGGDADPAAAAVSHAEQQPALPAAPSLTACHASSGPLLNTALTTDAACPWDPSSRLKTPQGSGRLVLPHLPARWTAALPPLLLPRSCLPLHSPPAAPPLLLNAASPPTLPTLLSMASFWFGEVDERTRRTLGRQAGVRGGLARVRQSGYLVEGQAEEVEGGKCRWVLVNPWPWR